MDTAVGIVINGIVAVFAGIAVLYVMMKTLVATVGRPTTVSVPPASKTD